MMKQFYSTKTLYLGSVSFRQWAALSHCHFIHGYGIHAKFTWGASELDELSWVVNFGATKNLKTALEAIFDHKTVVASNDPHLSWYVEAHNKGIIDMVLVDKLSSELFAEMAFDASELWLDNIGYSPRVWTESVELSENQYNSVIVKKKQVCACGGSCNTGVADIQELVNNVPSKN